jgi:hypothetical protein
MSLDDRKLVSEHVLEIRHRAYGTFLDMRGRIADTVAAAGQMTAWSVTDNRIDFKPNEEDEREVGFVSHRNLGYIVRSPDSRNYMQDRALRFIRDLVAVRGYELREVKRFGFRSRFLSPSKDSFRALLKKVNDRMPLPEQLVSVFEAQLDDYGPVAILKRGNMKIRVQCGPMEKEQSKGLFEKQADRLPDVGFFVDIDHYQADLGVMGEREISTLLRSMNDSAWKAIDAYSDLVL